MSCIRYVYVYVCSVPSPFNYHSLTKPYCDLMLFIGDGVALLLYIFAKNRIHCILIFYHRFISYSIASSGRITEIY